jgi:Tol biopolymer transport system component
MPTASRVLLLLVLLPALAASRPPAREGGVLVYGRGPDGARDLYVIPIGGGESRPLTRHPGSDGLPRWTADGTAVVFASNRTGNWQLWRVPADGERPKRVRVNGYTEWQAAESPDGRHLAFLSNKSGRECLWVLDQQTGEMREVVRHGRRTIMGNPHWSPDGGRIVFSSNWKAGHQIHVVDVATGQTTRLSKVGGCEPRFSPDGNKVAYVHRRPKGQKGVSHIVEHDLATGKERVLVDWPALNYDPAYSPDGSEIAFASQISGSWEIYRQSLSGGKAQQVTFDGGDARYPDYRPGH